MIATRDLAKLYKCANGAKRELIIIDSYADNTILDIIKYNKQYHNLKVIFNNTFHDRYFILDNKKVYHCGASINRIGYKTFSITLINDNELCQALITKVSNL